MATSHTRQLPTYQIFIINKTFSSIILAPGVLVTLSATSSLTNLSHSGSVYQKPVDGYRFHPTQQVLTA